MVDLRHTTAELDAEIMDDDIRLPIQVVEVGRVGGLALGLLPSPDLPNPIVNPLPNAGVGIGMTLQRLEGVELGLLVVGAFQDSQGGDPSDGSALGKASAARSVPGSSIHTERQPVR